MPTTLNEILQHEVTIARLATGDINQVLSPALRRTLRLVLRHIREQPFPNTPLRLQRYERQIAEIIEQNSGWDLFTEALDNFAAYEAGISFNVLDGLVERDLTQPDNNAILTFINQQMLSLESRGRVQTGLWSQFIQRNINNMADAVNNIVRTGFSRGATRDDMISQIRTQFNGVLQSNAETLARTGYAHYANQSRLAMADNLRIETDWQLIFTFDSRISERCIFQSITRDRWPSNDPEREIPALHWGCRTTGVVLPRGVELEGLRPAIGGNAGDRAQRSFNRRSETRTPKYTGRNDPAFKAERVRASTDYKDWLRQQPAWFIDSVLGVTKGRAFRSGEYELSQFFDMTGRPLTLAELRRIDARVFG